METLTITERAPIIISGCLVPFELYDRVHALACTTGCTQFIGVEYVQPADLKRQPEEEPWDWAKILHRQIMMNLHLATGKFVVYHVDRTRDQLLVLGAIHTILSITPWGN